MPSKMSSEYGRQVRGRRTAAGLSVPELADRAGIDRTTLWRIEHGEVVARERTRRAIEDALAGPETQTTEGR